MTMRVFSSKRGKLAFPIQFLSVYLLVLAPLFFYLSMCDYEPFISEDFESYLSYIVYFSWFHLSKRLLDFPV